MNLQLLSDLEYLSTSLVEMAVPRISDHAKKYFHGTSSEKAGKAILASGIEPGDIAMPEKHKSTKGPNLTPVPGKVYITSDFRYAQIYAIGGDMAGSSYKPQGSEAGYLFVIDGHDLHDIQPDEDSVGEMAMYAARDRKYDGKIEWLVNLVRNNLTSKQWAKLLDGSYTMYAHAGKKVLSLMSDAQKHQLIDLGAHVAHTGKLIPKEAYKIDFTKIKDLKRDGSNFFDHAEKIK